MQGNREVGDKIPYIYDQHHVWVNRESKAKIYPTFRIYAKCREIGKARRKLRYV